MPMKIAILGATGRIGRELVDLAIARGHRVTAQSRSADATFPSGVAAIRANPLNEHELSAVVAGQDVVIYAMGHRGRGHVDVFSSSTKALLAAMGRNGIRRLIAITGVGAGETRGHGGWFYDRIIFPLFTKDIYADKERQEDAIRASDVDWTLLRPAPFARTPGAEPFHTLTHIRPGTRLSRITPAEVASFTLDCAEQGRYVREAVFFGHGTAG